MPYARLSASICGCLCLGAALGGEAPSEKGLTEQSFPLRTALHHDPTMAAPFERLLGLYRSAGRLDELVGVYRAHVAQYPHDVRARTVLVRIMMATGDPESPAAARSACEQHPANAYLYYLWYKALRAKHDPKALAQLDRAIELEKLPGRKREWLDLFLPEADASGRRDLAEKHLRAMARLAGDAPRARLDVARRMIRFEHHGLALEVLARAVAPAASPEIMVEMELAAASAEVGLDRMDAAASRLERLLSKLTADHWRRPAILRRRMALVKSEAEREAMIRTARRAMAESPAGHPNHEAAVLDLAELLAGFERRRDALGVLLEAGRRAPGSVRIEQATLDLFDRLRDERGREAYLAERIEQAPDRAGIVLGHVKSLYLLGRAKEAVSEFDDLIDPMAPEDRFRRLLEMARFLRRSNLASDAAELFRRVVELDPSRLDVRRELAETYLALGDRARAAELFADELPKEVQTEHLLDMVQFMIEQELYREARGALEAAADEDETNLEIRTLLVTVEGRLANQTAGERVIVEARQLADTVSRYRLWLESAVAFHDIFDSVEEFLEDERARLDLEHGGWTASKLERRMVFADVAARTGSTDTVAAMIREYLVVGGEAVPSGMKIKLRRRLVAVLDKEPGASDAVEEELKALIEDDPQSADEYNARLALLYQKRNRADLAYQLIDKVKIARLKDAVLLGRLEPLYRSRGGGEKVMRVLERLTALDPTNRGTWERWLQGLASTGDELRLRGAILRLLAGIERMPLAKETSLLLRAHLVDSYWRSIAKAAAPGDLGKGARRYAAAPGNLGEGARRYAAASGSKAKLSDALALVASVERALPGGNGARKSHSSGDPHEFLWVTWTRAYLLNRLERTEARDEAIAELERVARLVAPGREAPKQGKPGSDPAAAKGATQPGRATSVKEPDAAREGPETVPPVIAFPDGLTVSLASARELLTGTPEREAPRRPRRRGPLPEFRVRWAFETGPGSPVTRILPLEGGKTLICDIRGGMHCVDSVTGKLLWDCEGALPPVPQASSNNWHVYGGSFSYYDPPVPTAPISDSKGRILVPGAGKVECLSAKTGRLIWRAGIGSGQVRAHANRGASGRPFVSVFVRGEEVLAWDPVSCEIAAFDRARGKLLREKALPPGRGLPAGWLSSGASLSGDKLLVYGGRAAVLDAETCEVEWSFEPARVRKFPVRLKEPASGPATAPYTTATASSGASPFGFGGFSGSVSFSRWGGRWGYRGRHYPQPPQYISHLGSQSTPPPHSRYGNPSGTVLAAPAVVWAAGSRGQSRLGKLHERWLLLFDQQTLFVLDLDLPLAARQIHSSGTFVGVSGRKACLLQQGSLLFADMKSGSTKSYSLAEVNGGQTNARVGACVDGPHVYLTGPGGITCVNARAVLRVAHSPWPKSLKSGPAAMAQSIQYYLQGTVSYANNRQGPCMPLVERVADGILYATPTPCRVVALVEKD